MVYGTKLGMKKISIAHSPDADDAFMFYALTQGKIPCNGIEVENVLCDIETLNQAAFEGTYDFTAVSVAAYPKVKKNYLISPVGASVGDNYGPLVVSQKPLSVSELKKVKIAIPGIHTSAFLALKLLLNQFDYKVIPFNKIIPAVLAGDVDAGLIIHEGQLTYLRTKLRKVIDLGEWWFQKYHLPLPLGVNVMKRDVPPETAKQLITLLSQSIDYALKNRQEAMRFALQYSRETPSHLADKFVGMYVNHHTVQMPDEVIKAIELMLHQGYTRGIFNQPTQAEFLK